MTAEEASTTLSGFSAAQKARFNQTSNAKVYDESNQMLSTAEQEAADNLAEDLNNESQSFINDMNTYLDDDEKLSGWPC